jgi:hypothetical protein
MIGLQWSWSFDISKPSLHEQMDSLSDKLLEFGLQYELFVAFSQSLSDSQRLPKSEIQQ